MRPILPKAWATAWAIAWKDLKLLLRDKVDAFFTFVFPLLLAFFFGAMFGGSGAERSPVVIAVVDESHGPAAKAFINDLEADPLLEATIAATREEAEAMVRRGTALACIVLPESFEGSIDRMFTGGGIEIEAIVDPSRQAETGLLTGKLNELAFRQMARSFSDPTRMNRMMGSARLAVRAMPTLSSGDRQAFLRFLDSAEELSKARPGEPEDGELEGNAAGDVMGGFMPAKVTITELQTRGAKGPRSAYVISFPQGVAWGLMGVVMSFGAGIARERSKGTLVRLAVAPIARRDLLAGKALGCFIASLAVITLLILFGRIFLGVTVASPGLFLVAAVAAALGFSGVMMLLAGVCRTEAAAHGAGRAVVLILAMIGGGSIPLFFMPKFMQMLSSISPFKWAILAIEGAIWRGFTPGEMVLPVAVLLGFAVIGFAVGAMAFRRAEAR